MRRTSGLLVLLDPRCPPRALPRPPRPLRAVVSSSLGAMVPSALSEGKSVKIRQVGGRVVTHSLCDLAAGLSLEIGYEPREGTTGSKLPSVGEANQVRVSKMQEAGES